MKKIFSTLLMFVCLQTITFGQERLQRVQGTIGNGSSSNSVMLKIKCDSTFSGSISNVQFTVQIPNTVSPQPTATIKSNPLSANIPTANYITQVADEDGYYTYLFSATTASSPAFSFTADTEVPALEVEFASPQDPPIQSIIRFAHLPSGGSTGQLAFYMEVGGKDYTNYTDMFYGLGSNNGGIYEALSYIYIEGITVPIRMVNFNVAKLSDAAQLNWKVDNQTVQNKSFDIERSLDGTHFDYIGTVMVNSNVTSSTYQFYDRTINTFRNNSVIYYRLKQMNKDNSYTYSEIKNIKLVQGQLPTTVFPNPASDLVTVKFELSSARSLNVMITDMAGKKVKSFVYQGIEGINQMPLNIRAFSKGNYTLVITDGENQEAIQVIKL